MERIFLALVTCLLGAADAPGRTRDWRDVDEPVALVSRILRRETMPAKQGTLAASVQARGVFRQLHPFAHEGLPRPSVEEDFLRLMTECGGGRRARSHYRKLALPHYLEGEQCAELADVYAPDEPTPPDIVMCTARLQPPDARLSAEYTCLAIYHRVVCNEYLRLMERSPWLSPDPDSSAP
jgi:hypothetical protein